MQRLAQPSASSPTRQDHLPAPPPVEAPVLAQVHRCPAKHNLPRKSRCATKAFAPEDGRPFEAWTGSAVPASVSPPTVSALPRVFAAICKTNRCLHHSTPSGHPIAVTSSRECLETLIRQPQLAPALNARFSPIVQRPACKGKTGAGRLLFRFGHRILDSNHHPMTPAWSATRK